VPKSNKTVARKPKCTWIDADHSNSIKDGLIFIHWPSFAGKKKHSSNPHDYCGYPALRAYTTPTDEGATGTIFRKEEGTKVKRVPDSHLVIGSEPSQNATILC
jgi:hypothetical protein